MNDNFYIITATKPEADYPHFVTILNEYNSTQESLSYMIQGSLLDATKFEESEKDELQKYFDDCVMRFSDRKIEIGIFSKNIIGEYGSKRFPAKDLLPHKKPFPKEGSFIYSIFTAEDGSLYVDEDIYTKDHDGKWGGLSFWTFESTYQHMVKMAMDTGASYRKEEV